MDILDVHILRGNKTSGFPQRMLFIDTETKSEFRPEFGCNVHTFVSGWTWLLRKKKSGYSIDGGKWNYYTEKEEMVKSIEASLVKRQPTYLFASNPMYDIGATGFIPYFTEAGFECKFYYSGGMTFMLFLTKEQKTLKVLGMQNFLPTSIEKVGEMIGLPKLDIDFDLTTPEELKTYCRRDTEILGKGMIHYFNFCAKHNLGGFAPSISGQSMHAYRHKAMDHEIMIFHGPEIQELERNAYFGGRCECGRIGELPKDEYVVLDVNSMYPYVMKNNDYPTKLFQCRQRLSPSQIESLLEDKCLIAECEIETATPMYPVRLNDRLVFPTGHFWATLTTPSIDEAIRRGHLVSTERVLVYLKAPIFTRYVDFFYALREAYQDQGNEVMDYVTKRFLNSLYGKWGEKRDVEIRNESTDSTDFTRTHFYNEVTGKTGFEETMFHRFRIVEGWKEAPNSFPGISAHCTDYARVYLNELMEQIGRENVLYCDTDSIVIRKENMGKLFTTQIGKRLGQLKIEKEFIEGVIYGPKDYRFGDTVRTKGVRQDAEELAAGVFRQDQFPSMIGLMSMSLPYGVPVKRVTKHLQRSYKKGDVSTDGHVTPLRMDQPSFQGFER